MNLIWFVAWRTDRPWSRARRRTARPCAAPTTVDRAGHVRLIRVPYDWARNGI
jgi:hypothetical protein